MTYNLNPSFTYLQFSHHPLDEVVAQLHPLKASLGGGDGIEDGCIYLINVLLWVKSGELTDDTLREKHKHKLSVFL